MQPGIYSNISNDDYHGGEGISVSGLKIVQTRSPLHYLAYREAVKTAGPKESTPAQAIGTAFHALMLEPELFTATYTLGLRMSDVPHAIDSKDVLLARVEELNVGRQAKLPTTGTKDELISRILEAVGGFAELETVRAGLQESTGKELKAHIEALNEARKPPISTNGKSMAQLAEILRENGQDIVLWDEVKAVWMQNNGHRQVLEPEQWDQLMNMRAAVMAHPMAAKLMAKRGKAEYSFYWRDAETGELCRIRPDWWLDADSLIVDVKTCDDASIDGFRHSIEKWGYDAQDAFYTDGAAAVGKPIKAFIFLAVEKSARVVNGQPLGVNLFVLDDASRDLGRAKYRSGLAMYAAASASNDWPCYGEKINPISLSSWQFTKNAHLLTAE